MDLPFDFRRGETCRKDGGSGQGTDDMAVIAHLGIRLCGYCARARTGMVLRDCGGNAGKQSTCQSGGMVLPEAGGRDKSGGSTRRPTKKSGRPERAAAGDKSANAVKRDQNET